MKKSPVNNRRGSRSSNFRKPSVTDPDPTDWLTWLEQDPSFDRTRRRVGRQLRMVGLIDDPR